MNDSYLKIQSVVHLLSNITVFQISQIEKIFSLIKDTSQIKENYLKTQPFYINVIDAAARGKLKETGHSKILASMLRHEGIQKSFLQNFLNISLDKPMKVCEEYGDISSHIDIFMYDNERCVIIENKVNDASEQAQQIYRYVVEIAEQKLQYDINKNIYVVYLNPSDRQYPSVQTLSNKSHKNNVLYHLGDRFIVRSFAYDIVKWLKDQKLNDEMYLENCIEQYVDYLQDKFHITERKAPMEREIKQHVATELKLSEVNDIEKLRILSDNIENVKELQNILDNMLIETGKNILNKFLQQLKKDFPTVSTNNFYTNFDSISDINIGLGILINETIINFHVGYDINKNNFYYGIICDKNTYPKTYESIVNAREKYYYEIKQKSSSSSWWPIWINDSVEYIYEDFIKFVNFTITQNLGIK